MTPRLTTRCIALVAVWLSAASAAVGQSMPSQSVRSVDPAPRMMEPAEAIGREQPRRRYIDPRYRGRAAEMTDLSARRFAQRPESRVRSAPESVAPGSLAQPYAEMPPGDGPMMGPAPEGESFVDENHPGAPPEGEHYVERYAPGDGSFVDDYPPEDGYPVEGGPFYGPDSGYGPDAGHGSCGGCGQCDECMGAPHHGDGLFGRACALVECIENHPAMRNWSGYTGAQGFKGPPDLGTNGNFGFYKGFNYAMPFLPRRLIGGQFGASVAFSDFEGSPGVTSRSRTQFFATGGFFRRARCNHGFQGGAVLDYLRDDWYVNMDLFQVRGEVSYLWGFHEIGLWAAAHTNSDTHVAPSNFPTSKVTWQANDQYNLYYRANFSYGAVARMWVGLTGHGDVTFGGDVIAPLSESYAIMIEQNYLLPRGNSNLPNSVVESWGLTMALVWYPGARTPSRCFDPYRPLFTVVDNSSMFIRTPQAQ